MGILYSDAVNLLKAREGLSGGKAVTLGHLTAYFHPSEVRALRGHAGLDQAARDWLDAYQWAPRPTDFSCTR